MRKTSPELEEILLGALMIDVKISKCFEPILLIRILQSRTTF